MDIFADADGFRIAGLPLHPLLVHAVVVLTPLTALAVALVAVWPAARRRLGWAPPVAALGVAALAPVTVLAGQSLASTVGYTPAILHHEALGLMLIPWTIALLIASVAVAVGDRMLPRLRRTRPRMSRILAVAIIAAAVVAAAGTIVVTVLTGDAGARAVWGAV
ncbi:DUF2231 domain-containing protein [Microbacterium arabinogalactanolyticum]|uniref:DUF2231 domain-containing protein n=1 Tax=Microbacterium arabinogalactanolyticum TaxID=69365 RepID=UPI00255270F3|nr:DUF2231 domain-containing protein [Microbacterium arabinogalactanolyticum]GLC85059.1 hypothetical protein MIAR_16460 [Microbacterium arabinogalactanolyticum]